MSHPVSIRLENREIPTYVRGPDSPLPACGWLQRRDIYPYSLQTDISAAATPATHRIVVLENDFVRVEVLPDMGGRVYRFFDKTAGKDVFELPPSFKFQNVANRGLWVSGGIEFNFGNHGHTVNTIAPVSWAMRREPDGGAAVWVGCVMMPVESRWALRIGLRPDRTALDLEVHAMGPVCLPGQCYWWSNAGVEVSTESRFYYYGLYGNDISSRHSWPICDGLDMQWYRNRIVGSDMFLQQCQRDNMAFYDFGRRHGVAQVADRFELPGQKYFTWGFTPGSHYWDLLFSDEGHTYCEIQRGRNSTQADSDSIPAMTEDVWTEQWIPLNDTGGFSAVENGLILAVAEESPGRAVIRLVGTGEFKDLTLRAESAGREIGSWPVARTAPGAMFKACAETGAGKKCDRVQVTDADGRVLLDWTEFVFKNEDWRKRGYEDPLAGPESADRLFAQAEKARFINWPRHNKCAVELYERILGQDPFHVGALRAMAEYALYQGLDAKAIEYVRKALPRAPNNPGLLTILGWALLRSGNDHEALEAFANAARNEPGRRRGLFGLASVHLRLRRFAEALAAAGRLLAWNPVDKWGRLLRVTALRKLGRRDEAAALLEELLREDPLWARLHAEALLMGVSAQLGGDRRLADDSVYASIPYLELGFWEDAAAILEVDESNEPFSPAVRLAHQLYAWRRLGNAAAAAGALAKLRAAPVAMAHPWPTPSLAILKELTGYYPGESMLWFLLGNALAGRDRADEAVAAWEQAAGLGMANAVLFGNLAAAKQQKDNASALEYYRRALPLSGNDLNIWAEYDYFLASLGRHAERLELYASLPAAARERSLIANRRVSQLADTGRYDECLEELGRRIFYRGEFEKDIRIIYMEAHVGKALALLLQKHFEEAAELLRKGLEYPRNINVGRDEAIPNEAILHYFLGIAAEMTGDAEAARRHWQTAAAESAGEGSMAETYKMLAWHALGQFSNALAIAHDIEQLARGEKKSEGLYNTKGSCNLHYGLVQLFKGHLDLAREKWREGLESEPAFRMLRLHLEMPDAILNRMARKAAGNGQ